MAVAVPCALAARSAMFIDICRCSCVLVAAACGWRHVFSLWQGPGAHDRAGHSHEVARIFFDAGSYATREGVMGFGTWLWQWQDGVPAQDHAQRCTAGAV